MELDKATVQAIAAAVQDKIDPLAKRKVELEQQGHGIDAELERIDKALARWNGGLAAAKRALDLLFDDEA